MYFNTSRVRGNELAEYKIHATRQETRIHELFVHNPTAKLTPEDVQRYHPGFESTPITSIRRAFSNLANDGWISKTDAQIPGMFGRPIYLWVCNRRKT